MRKTRRRKIVSTAERKAIHLMAEKSAENFDFSDSEARLVCDMIMEEMHTDSIYELLTANYTCKRIDDNTLYIENNGVAFQLEFNIIVNPKLYWQ